MTQGDLAQIVGVERNTVSRWENSGVPPKDLAVVAKLGDLARGGAWSGWLGRTTRRSITGRRGGSRSAAAQNYAVAGGGRTSCFLARL